MLANASAERSRTLVTGFLGFGRFAVNPAAELAQTCGRPFHLIEVAYAAADAFVDSVDLTSFDRVILLGVAGESDRFRLEHVAHNVIGPHADVRGIVPDRQWIDAIGEPTLVTSLWQPEYLEALSDLTRSDHAGDYLCNYLYYRMLRRFGQTCRIGFLHVPPSPSDRINAVSQRVVFGRLLDRLEAADR